MANYCLPQCLLFLANRHNRFRWCLLFCLTRMLYERALPTFTPPLAARILRRRGRCPEGSAIEAAARLTQTRRSRGRRAANPNPRQSRPPCGRPRPAVESSRQLESSLALGCYSLKGASWASLASLASRYEMPLELL